MFARNHSETPKASRRVIWISAVVVAMATAAICAGEYYARQAEPAGIRVVLVPDSDSFSQQDFRQQRNLLRQCRDVMLKRLSAIGLESESRVVLKRDGKLVVFLPEIPDYTKVIDYISDADRLSIYLLTNIQTASFPRRKWRMEMPMKMGGAFVFISPTGQSIDSQKDCDRFFSQILGVPANKPVFDDSNLLPNAQSTPGENGFAAVNVEFSSAAARRLRDISRKNVGHILAVVYGKKLLMAPEVRDVIDDGNAQISGFANENEARLLAGIINSGCLKVGFRVESKEIRR